MPNGLRKNGSGDGKDGAGRNGDGAEPVHTVRSSTRPSRPCGRNRMTAIRMSSGNAAAILRRQIGGRKIIQHAENDAAENGAAHLIEAADDGGDEGRHARASRRW